MGTLATPDGVETTLFKPRKNGHAPVVSLSSEPQGGRGIAKIATRWSPIRWIEKDGPASILRNLALDWRWVIKLSRHCDGLLAMAKFTRTIECGKMFGRDLFIGSRHRELLCTIVASLSHEECAI